MVADEVGSPTLELYFGDTGLIILLARKSSVWFDRHLAAFLEERSCPSLATHCEGNDICFLSKDICFCRISFQYSAKWSL